MANEVRYLIALVVLVGTIILGRLYQEQYVVRRKPLQKLLLVSLDGVRHDYFDRAPNLPAFKYLRQNGVQAKYMKGAFPTLTLPSHFTIATGLYPESHGVVHNLHYNVSSGVVPTWTYFDTYHENKWWDNGAEPIWITAVKQNLRSGGYLFPGSYLKTGKLQANLYNGKYVEDNISLHNETIWHRRIDEVMNWFTKENLDMIAFYFDEPDLHGHKNGAESPIIRDVSLPLLSRTIMYLLKRVKETGLENDLNIIITSDHGHHSIDLSVTEENAISLEKHVDFNQIEYFFEYGPMGMMEPKPGYVQQVYEKLRDAHPQMKVYLKEDLPERWHYKRNSRIPSIVILANPGYELYRKYPGYHYQRSNHGYDNDHPSMRTIYYSIGPAFKKNHVIEGFESVDIYPLMCHLLGLKPAPNNGSLDILMDTLL
ncbi:unnamed protein product [Clavelina lepadiformis]|uniref:Uncharacterized protein n=1 Tax=Clavelina lepadiformis TaxID=159417 RepID=A0ABP0F2E6_CLALP